MRLMKVIGTSISLKIKEEGIWCTRLFIILILLNLMSLDLMLMF